MSNKNEHLSKIEEFKSKLAGLIDYYHETNLRIKNAIEEDDIEEENKQWDKLEDIKSDIKDCMVDIELELDMYGLEKTIERNKNI